MARCGVYEQVDVGDDATGAWVRERGGYVLAGHSIYANTGFVYFRADPSVIRMLDVYFDYIDEMAAAGRVADDQTHWNE